jgi:hypothetical protein
MAKAIGMVCAAGAFCLLVAGCDGLRDYTLSAQALLAPGPKDRVVTGSLETVAASTQDSLQQLGVAASSTREGDAIRVAATTKTGQHFNLVLTRDKQTDGTERTHVRFEWDRERDEGFEAQVLSQVEVRGRN